MQMSHVLTFTFPLLQDNIAQSAAVDVPLSDLQPAHQPAQMHPYPRPTYGHPSEGLNMQYAILQQDDQQDQNHNQFRVPPPVALSGRGIVPRQCPPYPTQGSAMNSQPSPLLSPSSYGQPVFNYPREQDPKSLHSHDISRFGARVQRPQRLPRPCVPSRRQDLPHSYCPSPPTNSPQSVYCGEGVPIININQQNNITDTGQQHRRELGIRNYQASQYGRQHNNQPFSNRLTRLQSFQIPRSANLFQNSPDMLKDGGHFPANSIVEDTVFKKPLLPGYNDNSNRGIRGNQMSSTSSYAQRQFTYRNTPPGGMYNQQQIVNRGPTVSQGFPRPVIDSSKHNHVQMMGDGGSFSALPDSQENHHNDNVEISENRFFQEMQKDIYGSLSSFPVLLDGIREGSVSEDVRPIDLSSDTGTGTSSPLNLSFKDDDEMNVGTEDSFSQGSNNNAGRFKLPVTSWQDINDQIANMGQLYEPEADKFPDRNELHTSINFTQDNPLNCHARYGQENEPTDFQLCHQASFTDMNSRFAVKRPSDQTEDVPTNKRKRPLLEVLNEITDRMVDNALSRVPEQDYPLDVTTTATGTKPTALVNFMLRDPSMNAPPACNEEAVDLSELARLLKKQGDLGHTQPQCTPPLVQYRTIRIHGNTPLLRTSSYTPPATPNTGHANSPSTPTNTPKPGTPSLSGTLAYTPPTTPTGTADSPHVSFAVVKPAGALIHVSFPTGSNNKVPNPQDKLAGLLTYIPATQYGPISIVERDSEKVKKRKTKCSTEIAHLQHKDIAKLLPTIKAAQIRIKKLIEIKRAKLGLKGESQEFKVLYELFFITAMSQESLKKLSNQGTVSQKERKEKLLMVGYRLPNDRQINTISIQKKRPFLIKMVTMTSESREHPQQQEQQQQKQPQQQEQQPQQKQQQHKQQTQIVSSLRDYKPFRKFCFATTEENVSQI